jgi:hypothetical protein
VTDWRADVLRSLPDEKVAFRLVTFKSAYALIGEAAYNRRMKMEDFCGRAALAVAAYDADEPWLAVAHAEPPIHDLRRTRLPAKRRYGRDFGDWQIMEMK